MATSRTRGLVAPALAALVLLLDSGCADGGAANYATPAINEGAPRVDARDGFPIAPTGSLPPPPAVAGTANCAQETCTVTLTPAQGTVHALGTHLVLDGLQANRAVVGVGHEQVRCLQGETVFAQPFSLTCSRIGTGGVTLELVRGD